MRGCQMLDSDKLKLLSKQMTANPSDYMSSFRKNLSTYVNEKDISLSEIAEAADLSNDTVKTFLYGDAKDCKLSTAVALARALHISVDELVGSGTISPTMCESIQIVRNLPPNFVYFVRWAIRYHDRMLREQKATKKAVNVMQADFDGDLRINNNFTLVDISNLPPEQKAKIYMGIRIPCDAYMPEFFVGDILLLANDRNPMPNEYAIVIIGGTVHFLHKIRNEYFTVRGTRQKVADVEDIEEVIGYVVATVHDSDIQLVE